MVEFLKNAMNWILEKEQEIAKEGALKPEEVEKQIQAIEEKREELRAKFEEEDREFAHILSKLSIIKAYALKSESK